MVERLIERALGAAPRSVRRLGGGCVGEVHLVAMPDGERMVAKVDRSGRGTLDVEGFMLGYLGRHSDLPVPRVHHCAPDLLVMQWLPGRPGYSAAAEEHAGRLLAALHGRAAPRFGLERDTLIGGLHQPNARADSWVSFFRERRLVFMARTALDAGRLDRRTMARIESLAAGLDDRLSEPERPALLHGDVWSGNVLADGDRITGFLDPAIYFGHPEIELAFITLFHTFGERFFRAYAEQRPIEPGFFEERRDLYNLYPLLVHVRLFGGGYLADVRRILQRSGC